MSFVNIILFLEKNLYTGWLSSDSICSSSFSSIKNNFVFLISFLLFPPLLLPLFFLSSLLFYLHPLILFLPKKFWILFFPILRKKINFKLLFFKPFGIKPYSFFFQNLTFINFLFLFLNIIIILKLIICTSF